MYHSVGCGSTRDLLVNRYFHELSPPPDYGKKESLR